MVKVGINGYGTIGKRVADAVTAQPDMTVTGVAKTSPNHEARTAREREFDLFVAEESAISDFSSADISVAGTVDELIERSDVIVDATPSGIGAQYADRYGAAGTPAIFQGGEAADIAETSFTACANYDDAVGAESVRVVSCNTTGLVRVLERLLDPFGVERVRATLVRRGGDPAQPNRGPINDILPDPISLPSHHGPDVQTIYPDLTIDTLGLKVPATLMHMHAINITLETAATADAVTSELADATRLFIIPPSANIAGTAGLKELAMDVGRPRADLWENCIWGESISVDGRELYLFQAIHQESDVIPENIDAIRAITDVADAEESQEITNEALGVGSLRER